MAHKPSVLANAASENQQVASVHLGHEGADIFFATLRKDLESERIAFVATLHRSPYVAHIRRCTRQTSEAALFVEDIVDLLGTDIRFVHQVKDCADVDVAAARPHGEALEAGHTHRVVDTLAMVDSADAGAAAEMASNDFQVLPVLSNHLGTPFGHEAVAGAVEPVAADTVLLVILVGDTIKIVLGFDGEVERSVEHRHLRHVWHHIVDSLCPHDIAGDVQRSQVDERLLLVDHIARNLHTFGKIFAAMRKPVAHCRHLLDAGDDTMLGVGQCRHHHTQTLGMVRYWAFRCMLFTIRGVAEHTTFQAYAFQEAFGHDGTGVNVNKLILERRATTVENQNFHRAENV